MMPLLAQSKTDEKKLLERIDYMIDNDKHYQDIKENELKHLKQLAFDAEDDKTRLLFLDSIYRAYSAYRYDSAYAYMQRGLELAKKVNDTYYITLNQINRASVLSVRGFYAKAEGLLQTLNPETMPYKQKLYYYFTFAWIYNYWESYAKDSDFAAEFRTQRKHYMNLLLQNFKEDSKNTVYYNYLLGENIYLNEPTSKQSLYHFMKAVKMSPAKSRIHAMSAYGVARYYKLTGNFDLYEKYLVEASVSDGLCQLKETVALQKLAYFIFKKDASNSKRAAKYIQHTMEDAQFFNNRLRMIEISNILLVIASANQQAAEKSRTRFLFGLIGVSVALIIILILSFVNNRQKNKLKKNKQEIEEQNEKQKEMNAQLTQLNQQLIETNIKRETYMRLFMDISAAYISKLSDYRKLVSRKIKANQTADLLKTLNTHKMEEEESQMFYNRFDKAFMELYPGFVTELNKLLLPECQLELPTTHTLTTEIRIYALMRLGVTDSQEIATLLYYSTQTIYNYKSGMRAKAKNRETFENDINPLLHYILNSLSFSMDNRSVCLMRSKNQHLCYLHMFRSRSCIVSHISHIITIQRSNTTINLVSSRIITMETDIREIGFYQSRFHIGYTHLGMCHINTQPIRDSFNGSLGGTINIASSISSISCHTTNIDDMTMITFNHARHNQASHGKKSLDIGINHLIPILKITFILRFQTTSQSCIIDQHINIAPCIRNIIYSLLCSLTITDIES